MWLTMSTGRTENKTKPVVCTNNLQIRVTENSHWNESDLDLVTEDNYIRWQQVKAKSYFSGLLKATSAFSENRLESDLSSLENFLFLQ